MALISTENLSKRYGKDEVEVMALDKVSLFIEEGEILSVMGTSGSGKSTLLNLSGFRLKKMGFIFQSCNLVPELAVRENILLSKAIAKENVMELLKMLNGDYGITIVMITYDFAPVKMTTRMITISGGRINSAKGHLNKVFAD